MRHQLSRITIAFSVLTALVVLPPAAATSPTACFTVTPGAGPLATVFQVDASCSTHPTTPSASLLVRWDWEDDGTYDTPFSLVQQDSHQYSSIGNYCIRLEVRDPVSNDSATTTHCVVVGPNNYHPSWGVIQIVATGSTVTVFESFSGNGWSCSQGPTASGYEVSCTPPPPPAGFNGWECNGILVSAGAGPGGNVNGIIGCEDAGGNVASSSTGDIIGPGSSGGGGVPQIVDVVRLYCRADPAFPLLAAAPDYWVNCGDP